MVYYRKHVCRHGDLVEAIRDEESAEGVGEVEAVSHRGQSKSH